MSVEKHLRTSCGTRLLLTGEADPMELGTRESGFRQQAEGVPKHRSAWADRRCRTSAPDVLEGSTLKTRSKKLQRAVQLTFCVQLKRKHSCDQKTRSRI